MFKEFKTALCCIMITFVLKSNNQYSEILSVTAETSMRKFIELNEPSQRREKSLANEKIGSRHCPIAAGFRGERSRSVKSHYITYEKPQYTI